MEPKPSDRAQADAGTMSRVAISLVVALTITALVGGLVLPIAIGAIVDDDSTTVNNQSVGSTENITGALDATLDSANASSNATYTLEVAGDSATNTISEGSDADFSLNSQTVNVNVSDAKADEASATFTYPVELGWSTGARSMWNLVDTIIILALFLFVFGIALAATEAV